MTNAIRGFLGLPFLERVVTALLLLLGASFLLTLTMDPDQLGRGGLWNALMVILLLVGGSVWVRKKRIGIPVPLRLRSPSLLVLCVALMYCIKNTTHWSADTFPARYLSLTLLLERDLDLDEFSFLYERKAPLFFQQAGAHILSAYPPWGSLLALPVYVLPVLGGISSQSPLLLDIEKLAAAFITALSVLILYMA